MRTTQILSRGWKFRRGEQPGAEAAGFDDSGWESVRLPHDWAISGPFAAENDLQVTRIMQDGEMEETRHYGRTGALPHIGTGFYRNVLEIPAEWAGKAFRLEFDGVMSHATVRINGREAGGRAFGYSSFAVDATGLLEPGANVITVRAENRSAASRWYPGAGIYREVRLLTLEPSHFNYNGVRLDASVADLEKRRGRLRLSASHTGTRQARLAVSVSAPGGSCAAAFECSPEGGEIELDAIRLWSPDAPELYTVEIELRENGVAVDRVTLRCGFRLVRFDADAGMFLNGKAFRMNGVCLHHDFGPFGAAFSLPELRRRFGLLKSIGCNALRTSHNPPDPKFLDLADETGFVVIDEAFDCWAAGKVANDYSCDYPAWHRTDLADLIRRDRHHVSVILWSIGNEINEQGLPGGAAVARELAALCHELDPSRPVTAGLDRPDEAFANRLPQELDIAGWNYKPARYPEFHAKLPGIPQFGSETASTFSSRGWYDFPFLAERIIRENRQCSSCDLEHPPYATTPDHEFEQQDACPWIMGEFVWTGFDYLGEPSPYNSHWPVRSSYYGIFDLAEGPGVPLQGTLVGGAGAASAAALELARTGGDPPAGSRLHELRPGRALSERRFAGGPRTCRHAAAGLGRRSVPARRTQGRRARLRRESRCLLPHADGGGTGRAAPLRRPGRFRGRRRRSHLRDCGGGGPQRNSAPAVRAAGQLPDRRGRRARGALQRGCDLA